METTIVLYIIFGIIALIFLLSLTYIIYSCSQDSPARVLRTLSRQFSESVRCQLCCSNAAAANQANQAEPPVVLVESDLLVERQCSAPVEHSRGEQAGSSASELMDLVSQ